MMTKATKVVLHHHIIEHILIGIALKVPRLPISHAAKRHWAIISVEAAMSSHFVFRVYRHYFLLWPKPMKSRTQFCIFFYENVEAETNWSPFCRRHFQIIFMSEDRCMLSQLSLKYVHSGTINKKPASLDLYQWWLSLLTHICVTLPRWVNILRLDKITAISQTVVPYICILLNQNVR